MSPPGSEGYDALPPILSFEEAIALQPPRSPIDNRNPADTEQESLLHNTSSGSSGRRPRGYRPPTAETDDESDLSDLDSVGSEEEVRREMHEFDIEEPDSAAYRWGKRMGKWRWKWRLRMPAIRLPRLSPSQLHPDQEVTSGANGTAQEGQQGDSEAQASSNQRWFSSVVPANLKLPQMNKTAVFILLARVVAFTFLIGFFYLLFLSDVFSGMARRLESRNFPPELVRQHVLENIKWDRIRAIEREFTNYAHMAGTEGDFSLAEDVERILQGSALEEVSISEYYVYLNYPVAGKRFVHLLEDDGKTVKWTAKLEEPELGGEKAGHQTLVFHGYSKSGDVRGPLVYANYGSRQDFAKLKELGIKTEGAIAIIRYDGTQPSLGLKVKGAEEAGFVGCLIYTDPADNGHAKAKTAPEGRTMPYDGVRRGSVGLAPWVLGDPLTPGWESTKSLPRMKPEDSLGLVKIPSLPLSANDAHALLESIQGKGKAVSKEWAGSMPAIEYWTGSGNSPVVQLVNQNDEVEKQPIWNVHGKIIGTEQHQKAIIIGSHRDAWATGATSPGSGTAIFLELAHVFGILLRNGWRPRRTIIFASWDATTYNMVGSTEFVEDHLQNLQEDGYAYINLDQAVSGDVFRASGSPVFHLPLMRALNRVGDPFYNTSLKHLWNEGHHKIQGPSLDGDHVPFQDLAGISSIDLGFGSEPYPKHSSYDNFHWMDHVGDPHFVYHAMLGQVVGLLILELASRPVLPFDIAAYAMALEKWVKELAKWAKEKGAEKGDNGFVGLNSIVDAAKMISMSAKSFEAWAITWETKVMGGGGWESASLGKRRHAYNDLMASFETALLDLEKDGGLPDRTQYKHVVFGPQKWGAYEDAFFPAIRDAIEEGNWKQANELVEKTAGIMNGAAAILSKTPGKTKRWKI